MKTHHLRVSRSPHFLNLVAAALLFVRTDQAHAKKPTERVLTQPILTKQQAQALPTGSQVAMVCAKCKTVQIAKADQKKGILAWFSPKTRHVCPGCGGYWHYTVRSVKGLEPSRYVHTCSKCGSESVFCCGTSDGGRTEGM